LKLHLKIITVIVLFSISLTGMAQNKYDFAIYNDVGTWKDGTIAFEQFLDWKGLTHKRIDAQYINSQNLRTHFKGIYFPGGDADYYNRSISLIGARHIQQLIADNGYYIGMCAGADFACDKLIWEGVTYDYPLNLFEGIAIGPIDNIAPWPNYSMTTINMNTNDEINQYENTSEKMLYWGGSTFSVIANNDYDIVATYADAGNQSAIIKFLYGKGRVLLIGPHPEIEEDSYRDHTSIVEELNDDGSDWNFLWTATDWLLKRPISTPFNSSSVQLYPNPANNMVYIRSDKNIEKMDIINQQGQIVKRIKQNKKYLDVSKLTKGIYFLSIKTFNHLTIKKLVVQ